jgi:hypothetical protein
MAVKKPLAITSGGIQQLQSGDSLSLSNLTSSRVPFAAAGGELIDSANMTFVTDTLSVSKIGIGVSVPLQKLHVKGAVECSNGGSVGAYTHQVIFSHPDYPGQYFSSIQTSHSSTRTNNRMLLCTSDGSTSGFYPVMSLMSEDSTAPRVGIGTTAPTAYFGLDIVSSAPGIRQSVERPSGGVAFQIFAMNAKNTTSGLSTSFGSIGAYGNLNTAPTPPSASYLYFGVDAATAYDVNAFRIYPNQLVNFQGNAGFGASVTTPTAKVHIGAGSSAAGTAPLKFTSGDSLTTAVAGSIEFTTDDLYFTITTGATRKGFVLNDGSNLTSGKIPIASTNGRLIDGQTPLSGTKVYYVSDSSGGTVNRKLTFVNGILTSET